MIRYIDFNRSLQEIQSFCSSRVLFSKLKIKLDNPASLVDIEFLNKLKKYNRHLQGGDTSIIREICSKCDGYGFIDWVTKLTTDNNVDDEEHYKEHYEEKANTTIQVIVANENPIQTVYLYDEYYTTRLYYVSSFKKDDLTYPCNKCLATGLYVNKFKLILLTDEITKMNLAPKPSKISFLKKIWNYITQ